MALQSRSCLIHHTSAVTCSWCLLFAGQLASWTLAECIMLFVVVMVYARYKGRPNLHAPNSPTYADLKKRVEDLDIKLAAAKRAAAAARPPISKQLTI
jgi:hypothetical protein